MSTVTTEFNLRRLVRDVIESGDGTMSPTRVAVAVLADIPDDHLRQALAATLPGYIAKLNGIDRRDPLRTPVQQNLSPKVAKAIASNWERIARADLHVGDGQHKRFGDCTYADLIFAATERREKAAKHLAWADRYARYADLMRAEGAITTSDLSDAAKAKVEADFT